ncbi:hypothetical protein ACJIZ3_002619 [Penstemon smallii]|uniref:DNA-3-methyladenine glycosylase I n=1 Tax=Penstemon smallii TaxID=265156 RepID=A0ABD3U8F7_9LAMI
MSVATEKPGSENRAILAPTGNRVRFLEEQRRKIEVTKKKTVLEKPKKTISHLPVKAVAAVVRSNVSADSSSDSSSLSTTSSGSNVKSVKKLGTRGIVKSTRGAKPAKIVPDGIEAMSLSPEIPIPIKRCDWITPNSEPLYTCFHDEEWGVPVHDDVKLFELLIYSQALAELSWPLILSKRSIFRKLFDEFDPSSVANMSEERLLSVRVHGNTLLSEQKLRAIVENAKQMLKVQQEFGSFSNYCWRFVYNKPIKSGFRYGRQIPAKTPKSELISKDLMQRGFRCVGPTVVYSFMQVAGIVNDHILTCFRYNECSHSDEKNRTPQLDKRELPVEKTCTSEAFEESCLPEPKLCS